MSQLKIYINDNFEIKALHYTDDATLKEFVIDRERVFGNHTDAYIRGFKYEPVYSADGVQTDAIVSPYMDYVTLEAAEAGTIQAMNDVSPIIVVNHSTLDQVKAYHVKAIGKVVSDLIAKGVDMNGHHYSLTTQDQQNINTLTMQSSLKLTQQAAAGITDPVYVAYHADGEDCTLMTAQEMISLGELAQGYVTYHTTRVNQLIQMIRATTTKRQCLDITYQTDLPEERQAKMDSILAGLNITGDVRAYMDSTIASAGAIEGEIYSNAGSMIDPITYDVTPFLSLNEVSIEAGENNSSNITIPTKFADPDKVGGNWTSWGLSCIFNVLTAVDNSVTETYVTTYNANYIANADLTNPRVEIEVPGPVVLSCLVAVGLVYDEATDKVNAEEKFYIIKTATECTVTQNYDAVIAALGIVSTDPSTPAESTDSSTEE